MRQQYPRFDPGRGKERTKTEAVITASGQNIKRLPTFGPRGPRRPAQVVALRPPGRPPLRLDRRGSATNLRPSGHYPLRLPARCPGWYRDPSVLGPPPLMPHLARSKPEGDQIVVGRLFAEGGPTGSRQADAERPWATWFGPSTVPRRRERRCRPVVQTRPQIAHRMAAAGPGRNDERPWSLRPAGKSWTWHAPAPQRTRRPANRARPMNSCPAGAAILSSHSESKVCSPGVSPAPAPGRTAFGATARPRAAVPGTGT